MGVSRLRRGYGPASAMTTFEAIKQLLTEDVPNAQNQHAELVAQISDFRETWKQFQEMKDQVPPPPPVAASRTYRAT